MPPFSCFQASTLLLPLLQVRVKFEMDWLLWIVYMDFLMSEVHLIARPCMLPPLLVGDHLDARVNERADDGAGDHVDVLVVKSGVLAVHSLQVSVAVVTPLVDFIYSCWLQSGVG